LYNQIDSNNTPNRNNLLKIISGLTVLSAIIQIVLGGIVRITESGLGCPDWPLCFEQIVPAFKDTSIATATETAIEFSHRVSGAILIFFVLVTTIIAWKKHTNFNTTKLFAILTSILVLITGAFGGITVLTELPWWSVLIHLSLAEFTLASSIVVWISTWESLKTMDYFQNYNFEKLTIVSLIGLLVLIMSGSYMVGLGYGSSCSSWPFCGNEFFPTSKPYIINMVHRFISIFVGIILIYTAFAGLKIYKNNILNKLNKSLIHTFLIQILFGASIVWLDFHPHAKLLHYIFATIIWSLLVIILCILNIKKYQIKNLNVAN
tara:strand:+ start:40636 stop:41595 length:960 start_codon:yes stop_codon:yes gene_type:complete